MEYLDTTQVFKVQINFFLIETHIQQLSEQTAILKPDFYSTENFRIGFAVCLFRFCASECQIYRIATRQLLENGKVISPYLHIAN